MSLKCLDCRKPYKSFGLDMTLPDDQWRMIHDSEGGLLCANCMVARASKLKGAVAVRAKIEFADFTAEQLLEAKKTIRSTKGRSYDLLSEKDFAFADLRAAFKTFLDSSPPYDEFLEVMTGSILTTGMLWHIIQMGKKT